MDFIQRKRKLINNISILDYDEKRHIFHILKKNNVSFTKNQNGYFFNFTNIDDKILEIVEKCVDVIITHRQELQILDEKRDFQIREFKEMISKTMREKIIRKTEEEVQKLKLVETNISINKIVKQKIDVKRKYIDPNTIDYEMKQMHKLPKYPKNTVYWRLLQKINSRTKYNSNKKDIDKFNETDDHHNVINIDDDNIDDDLDYSDDFSEDKISDDFDKLEEEDDEIINDDEEFDNEDNDSENDDHCELNDENENEIEIDLVDNKSKKKVKTKTDNDVFNEKYLHFKNILKTKGFNCIENNFKLKEEPYLYFNEESGEIFTKI